MYYHNHPLCFDLVAKHGLVILNKICIYYNSRRSSLHLLNARVRKGRCAAHEHILHPFSLLISDQFNSNWFVHL